MVQIIMSDYSNVIEMSEYFTDIVAGVQNLLPRTRGNVRELLLTYLEASLTLEVGFRGILEKREPADYYRNLVVSSVLVLEGHSAVLSMLEEKMCM